MIKTAINTRTIKYTSRCIAMKSHDPRRTVMHSHAVGWLPLYSLRHALPFTFNSVDHSVHRGKEKNHEHRISIENYQYKSYLPWRKFVTKWHPHSSTSNPNKSIQQSRRNRRWRSSFSKLTTSKRITPKIKCFFTPVKLNKTPRFLTCSFQNPSTCKTGNKYEYWIGI